MTLGARLALTCIRRGENQRQTGCPGYEALAAAVIRRVVQDVVTMTPRDLVPLALVRDDSFVFWCAVAGCAAESIARDVGLVLAGRAHYLPDDEADVIIRKRARV